MSEKFKMEIKKVKALGLMSGSSLDGVDAALISTDGVDVYECLGKITVPYEDELRDKIAALTAQDAPETSDKLLQTEAEMTRFHAEAALELMADCGEKADVIGFFGHTLVHDPQKHYNLHIGDGQLLADICQTRVVNNFAAADLMAGGQGAPLTSVFHNALLADLEKPAVVLNIGGVTSLTWIGNNGEMLAFDTGPGNAPINDWVMKHAGQHMDYNGRLAITGQINGQILVALMKHKYFAQYPPKAVDRNAFRDKLEHLEGLSLEDGAATATAFVAESIVYAMAMYLPAAPKTVIVSGGGARNPTLMRFLKARLENIELKTSEDLGFDCDAAEAAAFAFLAVRRLYNMPASFPETTGVPEPISCGSLFLPQTGNEVLDKKA